jgi:hypothetical protein
MRTLTTYTHGLSGSGIHGSWYLDATDSARGTSWLNGLMFVYSSYGIGLFAIFIIAAWWMARRAGRGNDDRCPRSACRSRLRLPDQRRVEMGPRRKAALLRVSETRTSARASSLSMPDLLAVSR